MEPQKPIGDEKEANMGPTGIQKVERIKIRDPGEVENRAPAAARAQFSP